MSRTRRFVASFVTVVALAGIAGPAAADQYDPQMAAHPLRIVAYALHPVGVVLDVLIARPAHWLVTRDGMRQLFGHDRYLR